MRTIRFITHPDVVIDPSIPVPDWRLSERGLARMRAMLSQVWVGGIGAVWSSIERKARDGAEILAAHLGLGVTTLESLGENDRSATGYLPGPDFQTMADRFFAHPGESIEGWERAVDAQSRIVAAVAEVVTRTPGEADIAIVAHGGVGALLLCHATGMPISRAADQPGSSGGHVFAVRDGRLLHGWQPIDG